MGEGGGDGGGGGGEMGKGEYDYLFGSRKTTGWHCAWALLQCDLLIISISAIGQKENEEAKRGEMGRGGREAEVK